MISLDGAGLLAQVIPVIALVVAVEGRALGPAAWPKTRWGAYWYLIRLGALGVSVLVASLSETYCIIAVAEEQAPRGATAWFIFIGTFALGFVAVRSLVALAMRGFTGALQVARDSSSDGDGPVPLIPPRS